VVGTGTGSVTDTLGRTMSSSGALNLETLGERPFSFFPPIIGVEHNEWVFRRATWSEILVKNTKSEAEVWIPRRSLGAISKIDEPTMIVGLVKEFEMKGGQLWPTERRVIEMPRPVGPSPSDAPVEMRKPTPAEVIGIRSSGNESKIALVVGAVLILGVLGCFLVVSFFSRTRIEYTAVMQEDLGFTASDDYFSVVRKLGEPASDHWKEPAVEMEYRALGYPDRKITVILMGPDRKQMKYLGAMSDEWRPVHTVTNPARGNSKAMLQGLKKF
jgi:hypothetical protein